METRNLPDMPEIIKDIYQELLGPLNGKPDEVLDERPGSIFLTGVLESRFAEESGSSAEIRENETGRNISVLEKLPEEEDIEDSIEDNLDLQYPHLNPALDPNKMLSSFGIMFSLSIKSEQPVIQVCGTWGRYRPDGNKWKRESHFCVWKIPLSNIQEQKFGRLGIQDGIYREENQDRGIFLYYDVRRLNIENENLYRISLYMVNETPPQNGEAGKDEIRIFQPQLRIVFEGCEPKRGGSLSWMFFSGEHSRIYDFPYTSEEILLDAKGVLCAAVWKEIDPLQQDPETFSFMWADGIYLREKEPEIYHEFLNCHLRTEFIPLVVQATPDFDNEELSLDPDELSELSPDMVEGQFRKLLEECRRWIEEKKKEVKEVEGRYTDRETAAKILELHEEAFRRIKTGVEILTRDRDALLCFNFANRAIATVQKKWLGRSEFRWRPFQIAYFLMHIEPITNPRSESRNNTVVLWIPTGGGKTESYLAVTAFTLAWRRRKWGYQGCGTGVISRYTLRMLTLQQYQRMLSLITACEYLRTIRWTPSWYGKKDEQLWGEYGFYAGLWVGGGITPNILKGYPVKGRGYIPGFIDLLGNQNTRGITNTGEEKAHNHVLVTHCPACGNYLAIPAQGISGEKEIRLFYIFRIKGQTRNASPQEIQDFLNNIHIWKDGEENPEFQFGVYIKDELDGDLYIVEIMIMNEGKTIAPNHIRDLLDEIVNVLRGIQYDAEPVCFSPVLPGYFPYREKDFAILCTNPECDLFLKKDGRDRDEKVPGNNGLEDIFNLDQYERFSWMKKFVPIPALYVDEQIYARLPSVLIATVDKFARLPFEPATASIFGNVNKYSPEYGFYRENAVYPSDRRIRESVDIEPFRPPDLIIQDELHLIEGPLGSLTALYETAVEEFCIGEENSIRTVPVYTASSATIKSADMLTKALFTRTAFQFPPPGLELSDSFFMRLERPDIISFMKRGNPGKIYIGIMCPGKGPLTPQVRIYSCLYNRKDENIGPIVGYYNAVRELAGGRRILEQDVPDWIHRRYGKQPVPKIEELSSRIPPDQLSAILRKLERREAEPDFIITTSIFGTGVDIPHFKLMLVNGQPKSTSTYIQATGRVGRKEPAIVLMFYRASRPRDLSHYEFFTTYHLTLYRYVEDTSVYPFSNGAVRKAGGPVLVALLRNSRWAGNLWVNKNSAIIMKHYCETNQYGRKITNSVKKAVNVIVQRNNKQDDLLKMDEQKLREVLLGRAEGVDGWKELARESEELYFVDYLDPEKPVVLGNVQHEIIKGKFYRAVYRKVPESLRNVEGQIAIKKIKKRARRQRR